MSENKMDGDRVVTDLGYEELKKLSDLQLQVCQQIGLERMNEKAMKKVEEALKDMDEDIIGALTMPPFVYISPPMTVMTGCDIRLASLMNDQVMDAHNNVNNFIKNNDPNDLQITTELHKNLLAHSLVSFRGEDFGGVSMPETYHELLRNDSRAAHEVLGEIRDKRMDALSTFPAPVLQRLIEFYSAFQMTVDRITQGDDVGDVLGKLNKTPLGWAEANTYYDGVIGHTGLQRRRIHDLFYQRQLIEYQKVVVIAAAMSRPESSDNVIKAVKKLGELMFPKDTEAESIREESLKETLRTESLKSYKVEKLKLGERD